MGNPNQPKVTRKPTKISRKLFTGLVFAGIAFGILSLAYIPYPKPFEGEVTAEQLNFQVSDSTNTEFLSFLNSIRKLQNLEIIGPHKLNLNCVNQTTTQIASEVSTIQPATDNSRIDLTQLKIPADTIVQLGYNDSLNQLDLRLNLPEIASLELATDTNTSLDLMTEDGSTSTCEVDGSFQQIEIADESELYLALPSLEKTNTERWIWSDFGISKLSFFRLRETGIVGEEQKISTLQTGKIRIDNQTLELKPQQFLIIDRGNIDCIRRVQLLKDGFTVSFRGKASKISAGIDETFPVETIEINYLSQIPPQIVATLLSFIGAFVGYLVSAFLADSDRKSN
ncbi:MAG: hypothetical protein AAGG02_09845 [Cyanobacteria bacterium P01_H01_bin.15]